MSPATPSASTTAKATTRKTAARRPAARKTTARRSTARKTAARKPQTTVTAAKPKSTTDTITEVAEKALLVPVGFVLEVTDGIADITLPYRSRAGLKKEIRRFERRGATQRNRAERNLRKYRTRAERDLRKRRTSAERTLQAQRSKAGSFASSTFSGLETRLSDIQVELQTGTRRLRDTASRVV